MYLSEERKVKEQFARKLNQDVVSNRKLFWKDVNERKVKSCRRIKDGNGRE